LGAERALIDSPFEFLKFRINGNGRLASDPPPFTRNSGLLGPLDGERPSVHPVAAQFDEIAIVSVEEAPGSIPS